MADEELTQYERAHLDILAHIEHHLERIADSTAQPDVHLTVEQVQEAWDAVLRIYPDKAVPFLQRLGITVD